MSKEAVIRKEAIKDITAFVAAQRISYIRDGSTLDHYTKGTAKTSKDDWGEGEEGGEVILIFMVVSRAREVLFSRFPFCFPL